MARAIGLEIKKCIVWKMEQASTEHNGATSSAVAEDSLILSALLE